MVPIWVACKAFAEPAFAAPTLERKIRLILGSLGLAFALALVVSPAHTEPAKPAPTEPAKSEEPPLQRPDVNVEIVPDREGVELRGQLSLVLIVTNKSNTPLAAVKVSVPSDSFQLAPSDSVPPPNPVALPDIAAFGTTQEKIILQPHDKKQPATFGLHKVPVVVAYTWMTPKGVAMRSAQTATVNLSVLRRFEEEGKSLPGGTAVFLYLLLPIVPAFFAFEAVDQLRRGAELEMPRFGTEHIVPAFLLAFLLSVGFVTLPRSFNVDQAYSDPLNFVGFLFASALLGALVPGIRWAYALLVRWRWGFREKDSPAEYLRKALLSPYGPTHVEWVEGTVGGVTWAGMQLCQPDKTMVLGARMQVTPKSADVNLQEVRNALTDRRRLLKMVKADRVKVIPLDKIQRGAVKLDVPVVTEGLAEFKNTKSEPKSLVEPIQ